MDKLIYKQNEFNVDLIDRLHDLVDENRFEDACAFYSEFREYIINSDGELVDYE